MPDVDGIFAVAPTAPAPWIMPEQQLGQRKRASSLISSTPSSPSSSSAPKKKKTKTGASQGPEVVKGVELGKGNDTQEGSGEWIKVEKRKTKKAKKVEAKQGQAPKFFYVNGEITRRTEAIHIADIRNLVLHLLGDGSPQAWLKVQNAQSIQKVVTLFVPGITHEHLNLPPPPTSATENPNLPLSIPLPPPPVLSSSPPVTETIPSQHFQPLFTAFPFSDGLPPTLENKIPMASTKIEKLDGKKLPSLPFLARTFSHACPTRAPGETTKMHSAMSAFFQVPVRSDMKKKRALEALTNAKAGTPLQHLLTVELMHTNDYPIPSYFVADSQLMDVTTPSSSAGWVETPLDETSLKTTLDLVQGKHSLYPSCNPTVYSIDCEMCLTEDGKELTRVCMIDYHTEKVVLDRHVRPSKPITDYLTRWSGITAEALEGVTTTLADIQREVLSILDSSASSESSVPPILLGHSLESDLKALKLRHPTCIDTALMYHHHRGRPAKPGLAWLTRKWCGREIQTRGEGGHDPEEDARACLELLKLKLKNGPGFGEFRMDMESIFERLSRSTKRIRSAVVDRGNPATWHGAHATTAVACKDDSDVLAGMLKCLPDHEFVFGRLMDLAETLGWVTTKDAETQVIREPSSSETVSESLRMLNGRIATLHASLSPNTALILFTGHSDPLAMASLNARKTAFENAFRAGKKTEEMERDTWWTAADGRALEEAVERAKRGLLFLCLKT